MLEAENFISSCLIAAKPECANAKRAGSLLNLYHLTHIAVSNFDPVCTIRKSTHDPDRPILTECGRCCRSQGRDTEFSLGSALDQGIGVLREGTHELLNVLH